MEIYMRRRQRGLQFYRKKKGLSMQAVKEVFSWIVLSVLAVFLAFMVIWAVGTAHEPDRRFHGAGADERTGNFG